ncbi:hypothetical protein H6F87_23945 [Cyanobacteria bacterium FACHB-502]|nr:hypothetical protein [Cyanobacteria bacterium FACHB-502]
MLDFVLSTNLFLKFIYIAQGSSSTLTLDASAQASIKWLFFNVILALLPLLLNLILVKIGKVTTDRAELLKDGELFFFSTTIAASSVGSLLFQSPSNPIFASIVSYLLMTIIMISTGLFALSSFLKLKKMEAIDKQVFSDSSAWCAAITIALSYFAFVQGGMK